MNERETIDRGWYYVVEPDGGVHAPSSARIRAEDGQILTRRLHGHAARIDLLDRSGAALPAATLLRASSAAGLILEDAGRAAAALDIVLEPAGTSPHLDTTVTPWSLHLDGPALAAMPSHHPAEALVRGLLEDAARATPPPMRPAPEAAQLPVRACRRAMFFESLMNTDMPHNDKEISQGVLHMISALPGLGTEVVLVNTKMPIVGDDRPVIGLENLVAALEAGPVGFIGITLLEGYWEGVVRLIDTIRRLGCRARIAVGGVMPSLAPEHVAAHLPEVSFVCRGAGEYFVPRLCQIVGDTDVDTPLTDSQRHALLSMDGMIVLEKTATTRRLLSCHSCRTLKVDSLDRVQLDLRFVSPRHIEGGVEISTSRGCIHKCTFCSILGRESYQARSAGNLFELLAQYEAHYRDLFGDRIPHNAYRVHFSDDDFACERERARDFFLGLPDTKFRLSSVQVAIGDLCRKVNGKLLAEPDHELLDAMRPSCFADYGKPIPKVDYYEDHRSRDWSSFLQIGVETYSDPEIARLGKGYKLIHVRTIVAELARRGIHMDGYFILCNAETKLSDMVEVFSEVARLKLRFPQHFHMRFPVVTHLVSYFTAASHRRHVRQGRRHVMKLRGHAQEPGHAEYDYPFVDHDVPEDRWVDRTVDSGFVTDERFYLGNLDVLRALWAGWHAELPDDDEDKARIARELRRLDDRPRRLVFEMLRQAWLGDDDGWPQARLNKEEMLEHAEAVLGPHTAWFKTFRHAVRLGKERRLVLASPQHVADAVELLLSSDEPHLVLHLRHPGLRVDAVRAVLHARQAALHDKREVTLRVDASAPVVGDADLVAVLTAGEPAPAWLAAVREHALPFGVVRVPPQRADAAGASAVLLAQAGVSALRVEPVGTWTADDAARLARSLFAAAPALGGLHLLLPDQPGPTSGHGALDLVVDATGQIGRADGLGTDGHLAPGAVFAHLADLSNIDRHALDLAVPSMPRGLPSLDAVARGTAPADKILAKFAAWRDGQRPISASPSAG